MRHFLDLLDLSADETHAPARRGGAPEGGAASAASDQPLLAGQVLGLVFEKPSLRTRVSFEAAMAQLGGTQHLPQRQRGRPGRARERRRLRPHHEPVRRCRRAAHLPARDRRGVRRARAPCPVINGLSDYSHPCQALGDLLTMQEVFGDVDGQDAGLRRRRQQRGPLAGRRLRQARRPLHPGRAADGYGFDEPFLRTYRRKVPDGELLQNGDPTHAVGEARRDLHRRLDQHGPGSRSASERLQAVRRLTRSTRSCWRRRRRTPR